MEEALSQERMADGDAKQMTETKSGDWSQSNKKYDIEVIKLEAWDLFGKIDNTANVIEKRNRDQVKWVSQDIGSVVNEDTGPWEVGIELEMEVPLNCVLSKYVGVNSVQAVGHKLGIHLHEEDFKGDGGEE